MGAQRSSDERQEVDEISAIRERLVALEQLLAGQQQQMAQQEAEIERLRSALAGAQDTPALILPAATKRNQLAALASRRSLLKLGGVAAAAGVAATAVSVARNVPAAYAVGTAWQTGPVSADTETLVKPNNSSYGSADILQLQLGTGSVYAPLGVQANAAKAALTAYDTTSNNIGVYATSSTGFGLFGVTNTGTGATGAGLNGTGNSTGTGVSGNSQSGVGVQGNSAAGVGGSFTGGQAPLALGLAGAPGAPSTGTHVNGEVYLDNGANVWLCVTSGSPGGWARVGLVSPGRSGGAISYLVAPVRLLDARSGASSGLINRPALAGNEIYILSVAGLGGSGIPSSAQGLICNVTVLGPGGNGNLSLFPAGAPVPTTASLTFLAGAFLANHVSSALGSGGSVAIQNQSGSTTPLVLDAVAYIS